KNKCGSSLTITLSAAVAMPLTHPQSIPLSTSPPPHSLIIHHRSLWRHTLNILPRPLVLLVLYYQYSTAMPHPLSLSHSAAHALCAAATRLPPSPHYQFGLFGPTILAIWLALDRVPRCYLIRATILSIYAASIAVVTLGSMFIVHLHGWPKDQLAPTLNEQI